MRLFRNLLQLAAVSGCAALDGYLTNYDIHPRESHSSSPATIDTETGHALLARRIGAAESTRLGKVDESILEKLNFFGGWTQFPLFGSRKDTVDPSRLLVVIEGYNGGHINPVHESSTVTIEKPDIDLVGKSWIANSIYGRKDGVSDCNRYSSLDRGVHVLFEISSKSDKSCIDMTDLTKLLMENENDRAKAFRLIFQQLKDTSARVLINFDLTRVKDASFRDATIKHLHSIWDERLSAAAQTGAIESSLLLLPSNRRPPTLIVGRDLHADQEAPMPNPDVTVNDPADATFSHSSNSSVPLPPLGSYLPSCFTSNETCNTRTNSCSGHGHCYAFSKSCFACKCGSTIISQDKDGKNRKSIAWGGSACERKDVSVPFFLFASFGVFMTAVVTGAIGMMYSMGSQELPSVIGAGVTGPRAQR